MNIFSKTLEVNSDILVAKKQTVDIINQIDELIKDKDELMEIRLILSELLINGIKHGNKGDISKKVYLRVLASRHGVYIEVKDEGEGINYNIEDFKDSVLEPSGRGLQLVRSLSDNLSIEDSEVKVHKKLKKRA